MIRVIKAASFCLLMILGLPIVLYLIASYASWEFKEIDWGMFRVMTIMSSFACFMFLPIIWSLTKKRDKSK